MDVFFEIIDRIYENRVVIIATAFSGVGVWIISKFWETIFPVKRTISKDKFYKTKEIIGNQGVAIVGDLRGTINYNPPITREKRPNIRIQLVRESWKTRPCKPGLDNSSPMSETGICFDWNFRLTITNLSSVCAYHIKLKRTHSVFVLISDFNEDYLLPNSDDSVDILYSIKVFCRRDQIKVTRDKIVQKQFPKEMEEFKLDVEYADEDGRQYLTTLYFDGTKFANEDISKL